MIVTAGAHDNRIGEETLAGRNVVSGTSAAAST